MGRPANIDPPRRVTINLPKSLLDQLEKEVPNSESQSLSGLIVEKIQRSSGVHQEMPKNWIKIVGKLKKGMSCFDIMEQVKNFGSCLETTGLYANLDESLEHGLSVGLEAVVQQRGGDKANASDVMAMSVDDLNLSIRAQNCLTNANIKTVAQLAVKTAEEVGRYRNFGKRPRREIQEKLAALGIIVKWV